jgi:hypothetical protein
MLFRSKTPIDALSLYEKCAKDWRKKVILYAWRPSDRIDGEIGITEFGKKGKEWADGLYKACEDGWRALAGMGPVETDVVAAAMFGGKPEDYDNSLKTFEKTMSRYHARGGTNSMLRGSARKWLFSGNRIINSFNLKEIVCR